MTVAASHYLSSFHVAPIHAHLASPEHKRILSTTSPSNFNINYVPSVKGKNLQLF